MKIGNTFKIAFRNILKNKTRSILTSLGIIIGVSSVIIMVGIGQGTQVNIERQIASLGTNLIMVFPGSSSVGGVSHGSESISRLTIKDFEKIKNESSNAAGVSPLINVNRQVVAGGKNWRAHITGASPDYFGIRSYELLSGDFFKDNDILSSKSVAVIGQTVSTQLFLEEDPVGKSIRIGNTPFKVVGLLTPKGKSSFGNDQDDIVIAPYTTVMNKLSGSRYLQSIYVQTETNEAIPEEQEELKRILRTSHNLSEQQADDFTIGTQTEITERAKSVTGMMTLLLGSIAAVSLIVGGIGIMNIMLVSVTERTREIGIRLAVGARSKDILRQFLIEAFVLSLTGGITGILISLAASFFFNTFSGIIMALDINIIIIAVLFSGSVGVFFGYYPAKKASKLNPIDALRYE